MKNPLPDALGSIFEFRVHVTTFPHVSHPVSEYTRQTPKKVGAMKEKGQ